MASKNEGQKPKIQPITEQDIDDMIGAKGGLGEICAKISEEVSPIHAFAAICYLYGTFFAMFIRSDYPRGKMKKFAKVWIRAGNRDAFKGVNIGDQDGQ